MNDSIASKTKPTVPERAKLLICPPRDLRVDSALEIAVAESLPELVNVLAASGYVVSIGDLRVTKCLIEYADLFNVDVMLLTGVPGCDYTPVYDQVTWSLDRVGYDALALEVAADDRRERLKEAERPKMAGSKVIPRTVDEVKSLDAPTDFLVGGANG